LPKGPQIRDIRHRSSRKSDRNRIGGTLAWHNLRAPAVAAAVMAAAVSHGRLGPDRVPGQRGGSEESSRRR